MANEDSAIEDSINTVSKRQPDKEENSYSNSFSTSSISSYITSSVASEDSSDSYTSSYSSNSDSTEGSTSSSSERSISKGTFPAHLIAKNKVSSTESGKVKKIVNRKEKKLPATKKVKLLLD